MDNNLSTPAVSRMGAMISGLSQRLRTILAPSYAGDTNLTGTGLINAQLWIDQAPWRPTGFWAAAAALLAAGVLWQPARLDWAEMALLFVLVDVLWGSIWRLSGGRTALLPLPPRATAQRVWMPYMQAGSPAARLLGGDHTDIWPFAVRVGAPAILLALAIAAVLGAEALVFTILVVFASALAWTVRRTFGGTPPLAFSLVAVGLPWALTLRLAPVEFASAQWPVQLALLTLWIVHQWGETRALSFTHDWFGLALMGIAEIGLCILLIVAQTPLWLALLVVLFLPAWLALVRQQSLTRMRFFWLAAMLSSALALGQTV